MKLFSFAVSLAALAADVYALFNGDKIETLTSDNWAEKVDGDDQYAWVVTFYADWCPYCKPFSDEYAKAAADPRLEGKRIKFGAVDVMANRDLTQKFGIKRSPTVKVFGIDRSSPEDYIGHRKQDDLVSWCGAYCDKHEFVVPPPAPKPEPIPEPIAASYYYNIDSIVRTIASQHDTRIAGVKRDHANKLVELEQNLAQELSNVKANFEQRLRDLGTERQQALLGVQTAYQETVANVKSEQAQNLAALDKEAVQVIEDIIANNKKDIELSSYIPNLGKDWINIEWNYDNRRPKSPQQAASYGQNNYNISAPGTPSAPQAPVAPGPQQSHSQYYGAPQTPDSVNTYYNQVQTPSAPNGPSTVGYPGAPSTPSPVYGYQQQYPSYGGPKPGIGGYNTGYNNYGGAYY